MRKKQNELKKQKKDRDLNIKEKHKQNKIYGNMVETSIENMRKKQKKYTDLNIKEKQKSKLLT